MSINRLPVNISSDFIRLYYLTEFDKNKKGNSGVVVDDACYELMFSKEKNIKLIDGNNTLFDLPSFYTFNYMKGPFRFDYPNTLTSFCVKLQPWMNASFVPTKASKLLNLDEFYENSTRQLHDHIFNSNSIDEMVEHVEPFLHSLNIVPNKDVELVKSICNLIYEKSGAITVKEISEQFSIYRQKLNFVFKKEVKYTLKTFINNIRIRSCLAHKMTHPEIKLTDIAYKYGFYDQAHFVRTFKNACGVTPSEYIKNPGYSFLSWEKDAI